MVIRHFCIGLAIVIAGVLSSLPAGAQDPGSVPPAKFTGSLTIGASLESGSTNLDGFQLEFSGKTPYPSGDFVIGGEYKYARTRPEGTTSHIEVANRLVLSAGIDHSFGDVPLLMFRSRFTTDEVQQIEYRFEQQLGLGAKLERGPLRVRVVPGLAFLHQDKNVLAEFGFDVYYGMFQDLTLKLTDTWSLDERFYFRQDFSDVNDYVIESKVNLTGKITQVIGVQLSFEHNHENLLALNEVSRYQKLSAGIQINF
jgi:hypothetical protein